MIIHGVSSATAILKRDNGKSNLSLKECVRIKKILGTNKTVDYLFEEGGEKTGGG